MNNRDLVIIGGGAAGLVVASVASQLGLQVTLIEKNEQLGGDCLHTGCIPSKTLIHVAKVASLMRRGGEFGLQEVVPEVDLGKVNDHVQAVIDQIQLHDDPERLRLRGVIRPGVICRPPYCPGQRSADPRPAPGCRHRFHAVGAADRRTGTNGVYHQRKPVFVA